MPQGSFFPESELHVVRIDIRLNELHRSLNVMLRGENRRGELLASSGVVLRGLRESELLPILMAECGNGFLYGDAREAVTLPAAALRARRSSFVDL
jgi:hypothetical protein